MVRHINVTEARSALGRLLNRVHRNKEYVVIEKNGLPIAVLMDVDEFEDYLEANDPAVQKRITASTREYGEGKATPAATLGAELEEIAKHRERSA